MSKEDDIQPAMKGSDSGQLVGSGKVSIERPDLMVPVDVYRAMFRVELGCSQIPIPTQLEEINIFFPGSAIVGSPTGAVMITPSRQMQASVSDFAKFLCNIPPRPCPSAYSPYDSAFDLFSHAVGRWRVARQGQQDFLTSWRPNAPAMIANSEKRLPDKPTDYCDEKTTEEPKPKGIPRRSILASYASVEREFITAAAGQDLEHSQSSFEKLNSRFPHDNKYSYLSSVWRGYILYAYLNRDEDAIKSLNRGLEMTCPGDDRRVAAIWHKIRIERRLDRNQAQRAVAVLRNEFSQNRDWPIMDLLSGSVEVRNED